MNLTQRMRKLAHSGGPKLALITKADLTDLVELIDQLNHAAASTILTQALARNVELRSDIRKLRNDCDQMADLCRKQEREARNHGDERRRYMANNKALQARVKDLDEEAADYHASICALSVNAAKHGQNRRKMRGEIMLLESKLALVRSAIE